MNALRPVREIVATLIIVIVTFIVMQSAVVVMHELTHSTVAWLLGDTPGPFDIVWGNPLTLAGWDEGVHYSKLFPSPGDPAEAIIGGSPLLMHTLIVTLGMFLLQKDAISQRKWQFYILYWFVVAHFMELIAYIVMRAFASGGDTGHFNRGLGLSPWILFLGGTALIVFGLHVLFVKVMPRLVAIFAPHDRVNQWVILSITAFLLFLWGSGLRVITYLYPDPQWMFGLLGLAAFIAVLIRCNPSRAPDDLTDRVRAGNKVQ